MLHLFGALLPACNSPSSEPPNSFKTALLLTPSPRSTLFVNRVLRCNEVSGKGLARVEK